MINREFETKLLELNTIALKGNFPCPPLVALNAWALDQMTLASRAPSPAVLAARTGANGGAAGNQVGFDAAVFAAVQSSPNGVGIGDLQSILAAYKRPNNQIGAALGRLAKKALIRKRGELWVIKTARSATPSPKATTVDKTIGERRSRRARGAAKSGTGPGTEAGTEQAASAG